MRWRPLVCLVVWLTAASAASAAAPTPAVPTPATPTPAPPKADPNQLIATRQNLFSIPYRIDRANIAAEQPVEVELHVSADLGVSWQLSGKAKPEQGSFVFRAPHDGEYWFSLRTI